MNLDAIQVELRPRRGWEAVDLGCSLVRRFAGSVWKAWFVLVVPAQVLLCWLLWNHPLLALTLLWWFKPFASSVVLQVLSRELFGQRPKLGQLARSLPMHWLKLSPTFLLSQRLNPSRCFIQPLFELEGNLNSKRRKQRLRALSSYSMSSGNLTSICLTLEPIILFGLLNLGLMAVPESVQERWWSGFEDLAINSMNFSADVHEEWLGLRQLILVVFLLVMLLLEPFYIGGGFLLYLNARTILEGWDVEVTFKRMSQRLQELGFTPSTPPQIVTPSPLPNPPPIPSPSSLASPTPLPSRSLPTGEPPKPAAIQQATPQSSSFGNSPSQLPPRPPADSAANSSQNSSQNPSPDSPPSSPSSNNPSSNNFSLLLLGLLGLSFALGTPTAQAQNKPEASAQRQAEEILADPDFEIQTTRIPKSQERDIPDSELELGWLGGLINSLSYVFLALLIAGFIALLVWLILSYLKRRKNASSLPAESQELTTATHLAGLDLRAESLPENIPASAQELWASGQQREALALLYRGSLAWLQTHAQLPILSADTEQDCLRRSRDRPPLQAIQPYFESLTQTWIRAAYAEDFPPSNQFQSLCTQWPFKPEMANQIQQALATEQAQNLAQKTAPSATSQFNAAATRLLPLCLLLPLLLNSCGEPQEWEELETGYLGEAKRNPFLAASRLLDQNGWQSQSSRKLNELQLQEPDFILAPAASVDDEAAVLLLKQAVSEGAHFCLLIEDGEAWINSFFVDLENHSYEFEEASPLLSWLEDLKIQPSEDYFPQDSLAVQLPKLELPRDSPQQNNYQLYQPSNLRFEPTSNSDRRIMQLPAQAGKTQASKSDQEKAESPSILSRSYGLGRVTVLASGAPFRNRYLADRDHAQLLLDLANASSLIPSQMSPENFAFEFEGFSSSLSLPPQALIILRSEASFFGLLWQHGWPAILAAGLALLLLLWARIPRRQPQAEQLTGKQRFSVQDQLVGMGSYFWNHGQREDLLGALRRRVNSQWRQQNPLGHSTQAHRVQTLGHELSEREQSALAQHANLPSSQVRETLQAQHGELSATELEALIRRLQHLLASLTHPR